MNPSVSPIVLLVALVSALPLASAAAAPVSAQTRSSQASASGRVVAVRLFDLAAVRRLFYTLARRGDAMSEGERAAALADFSVLAESVVGGPAGP